MDILVIQDFPDTLVTVHQVTPVSQVSPVTVVFLVFQVSQAYRDSQV